MIKVKAINKIEEYTIELLFNNGEIKIIDFKPIIDNSINDLYLKRLLDFEIFKQASIGSFGEIFWKNLASIKELDGTIVSCNYDCSPEFIYMNAN
jgi:Protein of unknown function (DUF2442)